MKTSLSFRLAFSGALPLLAALSLTAAPSLAKDSKPDPATQQMVYGRAPWPAQRAVLLLPLQLGTGWNLDKAKAAVLLPIAEQKLQQAMQRTGKFSTTQLHRYNPIFLRAIQDKILTREQVNGLVANPSLDTVQAALATMRFEQPPLIALVSMEQVTTSVAGELVPTVTTQVTGKLYEASEPVPIRDVTLASMPAPLYLMRKTSKGLVFVRRSASERILTAADNAFNLLAREWVKPLEDITLPDQVVTDTTAATGATATPGTSTPATPGDQGRPVITVPQGQVLGTFPKK
jgi:hypothetical protein